MSDISARSKAVWLKYELKNYCKAKFTKKPLSQKKERICCGKPVLDAAGTNKIIGDAISDHAAFGAGRMGYIEMDMLRQVIEHRMIPRIDHRESALKQLCNNAGFFPYDLECGERYIDLMLDDCSAIDLQGYWHLYMEDYLHDVYQKNTMISHIEWIKP